MICRHCKEELKHPFLNLGYAPPSNAYLVKEDLDKPEITYPLKLFICHNCWLVQTQDFTSADELFSSDYAYFSSTSQSWLQHASNFSKSIINRLNLNKQSFVIEIASNDGYLLKNFVEHKIPCLGIEPTESTADFAEKNGIPTLRKFFGVQTAENIFKEGRLADLVCGNNVYAHVPDINDFTRGLKIIMKPNAVVTLEFPHLLRLLENNQFDTVYHEHFSYLSLTSVINIFTKFGLRVFDVEELSTHGGSLRIYGCHMESVIRNEPSVDALLKEEMAFGIKNLNLYKEFQIKADKIKDDFLLFLLSEKKKSSVVVGYGAAAKGNTLMNYAGIKTDLIISIFDAAPSKQNKFMPGSHLPILSPDEIKNVKPDFVIIFPWNIADEVISQIGSLVKSWGGQFVVAVPKLEIIK
jgi:hypothetical protein